MLVALGLRVGYVQRTSFHAIDDASTYTRLGAMVARHGDYHTGSGYDTGAGGSHGPTAYFPPAYPYFLGLTDLIDGHYKRAPAWHGERLGGAVLGTIAVALLGLVALELFGSGTALVAMALAAVYPVFVELAGTIVAENLLIVFMLASVWTALRARRAASARARYAWIAVTGVLAGLSTLTHENAAVLVLPLMVAVAAAAGAGRAKGPRATVAAARGWQQRASGVLALAAATAVTIAPWTIRNAVELHHFVPVADETGITLRGTYNAASAHDQRLPYKWRFYWSIPQDAGVKRRAFHEREVPLSDQLESRALHYIGAHPTAPLTVFWSNLRRLLELRGSYAWRQSARAIGLHASDARIGVISFWVLCALALGGLVTTAARRVPRWLWAMPVLYALSILLVNVETPRFREPIDPFLVLAAACALTSLARRATRRQRRSRRRLSASNPATL